MMVRCYCRSGSKSSSEDCKFNLSHSFGCTPGSAPSLAYLCLWLQYELLLDYMYLMKTCKNIEGKTIPQSLKTILAVQHLIFFYI